MILYIDGGCSGNGQKDLTKRTMISVVTDGNGNMIDERDGQGGSNNIAELEAVLLAVSRCAFLKGDHLIYTDSKNNLYWAKGHISKKVNDYERTRTIYKSIKEFENVAEKNNSTWRLKFIPREYNLAGHYIENKYSL